VYQRVATYGFSDEFREYVRTIPVIPERGTAPGRDRAVSFLFARDGVEALAALKANGQIDLVVTDINMPRMDGIDLGGQRREIATLFTDITSFTALVETLDRASSDRCSMSISPA
jgi:CheY-like chemotaxis protein